MIKKITWAIRIVRFLLVTLMLLLTAIFLFFIITTSVTPNIDRYEYALPFEAGTGHTVVQGYGGLFSHTHTAAIDFEMPVGTTVCAAREGTVLSYKDDSDEGGPFSSYKNKANYVIIQHDDGSFGCYWHLQKNGVLVKKGRVSKGQPIGLSGATGEVFKPHLHFFSKSEIKL